jgi:hypothetical protein
MRKKTYDRMVGEITELVTEAVRGELIADAVKCVTKIIENAEHGLKEQRLMDLMEDGRIMMDADVLDGLNAAMRGLGDRIEERIKTVVHRVTPADVKRQVDGEDFLDSILDRIMRKQLDGGRRLRRPTEQ